MIKHMRHRALAAQLGFALSEHATDITKGAVVVAGQSAD